MHTRVVCLTLALSTPASAVAAPAAPTITPSPLAFLRRDLNNGSFYPATDCTRALSQIAADEPPEPTGALAEWLDEQDNYDLSEVEDDIANGRALSEVDRICTAFMVTAAPPELLASSLSSYSSNYNSWQQSVAPFAASVAAQCTGDGVVGLAGVALELVVATDVAQCTAGLNRYNKNSIIGSAGSTVVPPHIAAVAAAVGLLAAFALL